MQFLLVAQQAKGINKTYKSEIMVAMQVRDEYMGDAAAADFVVDHLYLGTFPAINEEMIPVQGNHLAGRMTVEGRNSRIISKDRNCEHLQK